MRKTFFTSRCFFPVPLGMRPTPRPTRHSRFSLFGYKWFDGFDSENLLWWVGMVMQKLKTTEWYWKEAIRTKHGFRLGFFDWVPRFSAQMCPHPLASTSSKLASARLAEVGNFWLNARGVVIDRWEVARLLSIFIVRPVGGETKIPQNTREQRKKLQLQCSTLLIYLIRKFEGHIWFI